MHDYYFTWFNFISLCAHQNNAPQLTKKAPPQTEVAAMKREVIGVTIDYNIYTQSSSATLPSMCVCERNVYVIATNQHY